MIRILFLAAALLLQLMPATAADVGSTASMAACRAITTDAERLACYDRVVERVPVATPDPASAAPVAVAPPPPPRALAAPAAQPATTETEPASSFGAEAVRKPQSAEPTALTAKVVGDVDGVRRDQIFLLDNGQRWRVLSDNEFDYTADGPVATIERNLIGTYWMRLGDRGPSFKVRRVQ